MAANRQTDIHTHAHAQCSHASVGLAQARPNKTEICCDQKYAVSVEYCTRRCYCELVTNVVYDNFQATAIGNTRNSLRPPPYISTVQFIQLK